MAISIKNNIVKAAVLQFDVTLGHIPANMEKVEQGVRRLAEAGADLVVLPEMWSCGFDYERLEGHAAESPAVLERLGKLASLCGVNVAGSLPRETEKGIANSLVLLDRNGQVTESYDKIHLFSPGDEHRHFAGGGRAGLCDTDLGRIGLMICYDLRFPELCRTLALAGAEIIVIAAQWPLARKVHWETLIRARAIENQVFVIAANRCGSDPKLNYAGHSAIVGPWGETLAQAGSDETDLLADLDLSDVEQVRTAIPCYADRRPGVYGKDL